MKRPDPGEVEAHHRRWVEDQMQIARDHDRMMARLREGPQGRPRFPWLALILGGLFWSGLIFAIGCRWW